MESNSCINTQYPGAGKAANNDGSDEIELDTSNLKRDVSEPKATEEDLADYTVEAVFPSLLESKKCDVQPDDLPDTASESSSEGTTIVHYDATLSGTACYKPDEWLPTEAMNLYEINKLLAFGAYGKVYLATDRLSKTKIAIKKIQKNRPENFLGFMTSDQIDFEVNITKSLDHINLIRCYKVFAKGNYVCMVLDYMEGGNLQERINEFNGLDEDITKHFLRQLCFGVAYLHEQNIVHFDLKPDNLLLLDRKSRTTVKVADFGCSKMIKGGSVKPEFGGTLYSAPELVSLERCSYAADIWSIGVVMFVSLSNTLPFRNISDVKIGRFDVEPIKSIQNSGIKFIQNLLTKAPYKRPNIHDILKDLYLNEQHKTD